MLLNPRLHYKSVRYSLWCSVHLPGCDVQEWDVLTWRRKKIKWNGLNSQYPEEKLPQFQKHLGKLNSFAQHKQKKNPLFGSMCDGYSRVFFFGWDGCFVSCFCCAPSPSHESTPSHDGKMQIEILIRMKSCVCVSWYVLSKPVSIPGVHRNNLPSRWPLPPVTAALCFEILPSSYYLWPTMHFFLGTPWRATNR